MTVKVDPVDQNRIDCILWHSMCLRATPQVENFECEARTRAASRVSVYY